MLVIAPVHYFVRFHAITSSALRGRTTDVGWGVTVSVMFKILQLQSSAGFVFITKLAAETTPASMELVSPETKGKSIPSSPVLPPDNYDALRDVIMQLEARVRRSF